MKAQFQLCYLNPQGFAVLCPGVSYRLMDSFSHRLLAKGVTDAKGETVVVSQPPPPTFGGNGKAPGSAISASAPTAFGPQSALFYLEVYDFERKVWQAPDLHKQDSAKSHISLKAPPSRANDLEVVQLHLKPYVRARLQMKPTGVGVAKANIVAHTVDAHGKKVKARDLSDAVIAGVTDAKGYSPHFETNRQLTLTFQLPGAVAIEKQSALLSPVVMGQSHAVPVVEIKSQVATTASQAGHKALVSGKTSTPAIVNAEAQELIIVPQKAWDEFEQMSGIIESTFAAAHQAKADLTRALGSKSKTEIAAAEKNLGLAEDKVAQLLNKDFDKKADLQEVITFESYDKAAGDKPGKGMGLRRRYIPADEYKKLKAKRLPNIPIKLDFKPKDGSKPINSKIEIKGDKSKGPAGATAGYKAIEIDPKQLTESIKKITFQAKKEWKGDPAVLDLIDLGGNQLAETIEHSDSFETEKSAQWLRLVGCAGASAEVNWNPAKGQVKAQLQGNLQGKLVLCEGKYTARYAVPSLKGWLMSTADIDLGAVRFVVELELYGFIGAKASIAGSAGLVIGKDGKPKAVPEQRNRADTAADKVDAKTGLPRFVPAALDEVPPKDIDGIDIKAEAFAGVEGGISPKGAIQWLPPQEKEFVSFAEVAFDVAGSAGAGASAQLSIYYASGKFRIKASARLCWGLGAKGALNFAVDAGKLEDFVMWVYYQLQHAGFKVLVHISQQAFEGLSNLLFRLIADDTTVGKALKEELADIVVAHQELLLEIDKANGRSRMVNNINKVPQWLIYATPETRGMLLYQVTRHGKLSHTHDAPKLEWEGKDPQLHYLDTHKQAVLNILAPVQTGKEWHNVMQHMTAQGSKSTKKPGDNERHVLNFLNNGKSLVEDLDDVRDQLNRRAAVPKEHIGNKYLEKYWKYRSQLMDDFPKGYQVALNDSPMFNMYARFDGRTHEMFAMADPAPVWNERFNDPDETALA